VASETDLIWSEFGDRLRRFVARRVANEADVEDILQEVFLRVHERLDTLDRADRLTSWLFQITRNAIIDHYRASERRRTHPLGEDGASEVVPPADPLANGLEEEVASSREELASCLRPMVERLSPRYRDALVLVGMEGLTQKEAAARSGLSISGMKSRVQRGRRALKEMLLDCCRVRHDAGGRVTGYEARGSSCGPCAGRRDAEG
jgi:RNA polymerase sigma-70 factor (ECF subfamily)